MSGATPTLAAVLLLPAACVAQPSPVAPKSVTMESPMPDDVPVNGSFDRNPPPMVAPVVRDGKRYAQRLGSFDGKASQAGGLLDVIDVATGAIEATIKVYDNRRDARIEGDAQDIFFASMAFDAAGRLIVTDEVGRRFAVDVQARTAVPLR